VLVLELVRFTFHPKGVIFCSIHAVWYTVLLLNPWAVGSNEICMGADKSLAFPISPTFLLILLLSHESLLFCTCLTYIS
jgi:hypothetical protein